MNVTKRVPIEGEIIVKEGISKKTNAPYKMTYLSISTAFGPVEILVDTKTDRAGVILSLMIE